MAIPPPWGVATPAPRPARAATPAGAARAGPGGYARQPLRAARHPPRPPGPARPGRRWPDRPEAGRIRATPRYVRGSRAENQVATSRPDQPGTRSRLRAEAGWRPRGPTNPGPVATSEPRTRWRPRSPTSPRPVATSGRGAVATSRPDQPGPHGDLRAEGQVATSQPRQPSARGSLGPRDGDGLAVGPERDSWRPRGRGGPGPVAASGRGPGAASGQAGLRGGRGGAADAEEVYVQAAGEPAAAQRRSRRIPFGAVRRTGRTGRAHRSAPSLRSGQRTGGYADHGGHLNAWPPSPAVSWRRAGPSRRRWRSAVRPDGRRSAPCPPKTQPSTTRSGPR